MFRDWSWCKQMNVLVFQSHNNIYVCTPHEAYKLHCSIVNRYQCAVIALSGIHNIQPSWSFRCLILILPWAVRIWIIIIIIIIQHFYSTYRVYGTASWQADFSQCHVFSADASTILGPHVGSGGCKNRACSVSLLDVVNGLANQGLVFVC